MRSGQHPLSSGFGPDSTAQEVIAGRGLTGKVAIVTGCYSGLGLEVTPVLTKAGALVIIPARNPDKACYALHGIERVGQGGMSETLTGARVGG